MSRRWIWQHSSSVLLVALSCTVGCNSTNLGARSQKSPASGPGKPGTPGAPISGGRDTSGVDAANPGVTIQIPTGGERSTQAVSEQRPLALVFAIDVTGSMSDSIAAVKNNVQAFADNVATRAFELSVGGIAFSDGIRSTFSLSRDVSAFIQFVESLKSDGGEDGPEGSLLAIREAVSLLELKETRPDALRGVMVITDTIGHYGTGSSYNRDCDEAKLIESINTLPSAMHSKIKFFFSAGDAVDADSGACARDPRQQYGDILKRIFPSVPEGQRGGTVDFPFSGPAFLGQLPALLEKTIPGVHVTCGPLRAAILVAGSSVRTWTAGSSEAALQIAATQKEFPAFPGILDADLAAWEASGATVEITYTCIDKSVAASTASSPKEKTATLPLNSLRKSDKRSGT